MKTLTVTAARQNLGAWLKKTLKGEDIGVMIDGAIVAFRPVKVYSEDYALQEYGVTDANGPICQEGESRVGRRPESGPAETIHGKIEAWVNPPFSSVRAFIIRLKI